MCIGRLSLAKAKGVRVAAGWRYIPQFDDERPEATGQPDVGEGDSEMMRLAESLAWRDEEDKAAN